MRECRGHVFWLVVLSAVVIAMLTSIGCEEVDPPPACSWMTPGDYRVQAYYADGPAWCQKYQEFVAPHDARGIQLPTVLRECTTDLQEHPETCGINAVTECSDDGFYMGYLLTFSTGPIPARGRIKVGYRSDPEGCDYSVIYTRAGDPPWRP